MPSSQIKHMEFITVFPRSRIRDVYLKFRIFAFNNSNKLAWILDYFLSLAVNVEWIEFNVEYISHFAFHDNKGALIRGGGGA